MGTIKKRDDDELITLAATKQPFGSLRRSSKTNKPSTDILAKADVRIRQLSEPTAENESEQLQRVKRSTEYESLLHDTTSSERNRRAVASDNTQQSSSDRR